MVKREGKEIVQIWIYKEDRERLNEMTNKEDTSHARVVNKLLNENKEE